MPSSEFAVEDTAVGDIDELEMAEDERWTALEITVCAAHNIDPSGGNLNCVIDFDDYEWKTRTIKKAVSDPEWNQSFELGTFQEEDELTVRCFAKQNILGVVRLKVADLLPDGINEKEYQLMPEDPAGSGGSNLGALILSVAFVEKISSERRKTGFWRKLCRFLLGRRRSNTREDGDASDGDGGEQASEDADPSVNDHDDGEGSSSDEDNSSSSESPRSPRVPSTVVLETENDGDDTPQEGHLFGRPLKEILERQREKYPDLEVPWFIWLAARCIREKGLIDTMGIFRVRGRLGQIKELKHTLNHGGDLDMDTIVNNNNIHNITSLIKTFLRELPTPLITYEYYDEFLKCAASSGRSQEKRILRTLRKLPPENFTLIKFLCHLMYDVSLHSNVNMMNAENLSKVLSPNLIWKETVNLSDLSQVIDMKKANDLAQVMITKYFELFDGSENYSDASASEEEFSDVSSSDDDDDDGNDDQRGGIDNLIERMKKGQGFGMRQGAAASSSSSSSSSSAAESSNPMLRNMANRR